jgi:hypothetical protein
VYCMSKTLPHESLGYCTIPLGNGAHILAYRVAKSPLVGRGYLLNWRTNGEGESNEKERGAALRDLYLTLASPWTHDTS